MSTPLLDRINARKGHSIASRPSGATSTDVELAEQVRGRVAPASPSPIWLRRLTDQDRTSTIYSNGENR